MNCPECVGTIMCARCRHKLDVLADFENLAACITDRGIEYLRRDELLTVDGGVLAMYEFLMKAHERQLVLSHVA